jgi:hypothetical protein
MNNNEQESQFIQQAKARLEQNEAEIDSMATR